LVLKEFDCDCFHRGIAFGKKNIEEGSIYPDIGMEAVECRQAKVEREGIGCGGFTVKAQLEIKADKALLRLSSVSERFSGVFNSLKKLWANTGN
jgi:hypothetical protein